MRLLVGLLVDEIVGHAKADIGIEAPGFDDIGGQALDMVVAQRPGAAMQMGLVVQPRQGRHAGNQFQGNAGMVLDVQRAALEGALHPDAGNAGGVEIGLRAVEVLVAEDAEAEPFACARACRAAQDKAVVATLLHASQIDHVALFGSHLQADDLGVELAAQVEVGDAQHDVAGAGDIEGG